MEWEEPEVIELSKDPDAEGACIPGSGAVLGIGCVTGAAASDSCSTGLMATTKCTSGAGPDLL